MHPLANSKKAQKNYIHSLVHIVHRMRLLVHLVQEVQLMRLIGDLG